LALRPTIQYAGTSGRAFFTAATTFALKLMTASCAVGSLLSPIAVTSSGTISGPGFTSMNTRLPTGTVASTSASVGMRSPANFSFFHFPTSSVRNSARVLSATTLFTPPAVRFVSLSWITTTFRSFVRYTSNSAASAFCSHASLIDATVFSGASNDAPRWPTISTGRSSAVTGRAADRASAVTVMRSIAASAGGSGYGVQNSGSPGRRGARKTPGLTDRRRGERA
jgi:hypothetical protein